MGAGWRPTTSGDWLDILRNAQSALDQNPDDTEASEIVQEARQNLTPRVIQAFDNERSGRLRDVRDAQPGPVAAAVEEFGRAGSFGLSDELAGGHAAVGALLPGGESPGQAYKRNRDEQRAYQDAARAHNPVAAFAGNVAGSIVNPLTVAAAGARPIVAAMQPASKASARILAAMLGGVTGGTEGAIRSVGESEESGTGMFRDVPRDALVGFGLGAGGTALGTGLARRGNTTRLQEQMVVDKAKVAREAASRAPAQTRGARANARRASRAAREFDENAPLRQTIMDERAATAPLNRQAAELRVQRLQGGGPSRGGRWSGMPRESKAELEAQLGMGDPAEAEMRAAIRQSRRRTPEPPVEIADPATVQQQTKVTLPETVEPTVPPADVEVPAMVRQRGASNAQLATRQTEIAKRFLAEAPTEQSATSIRALFANMPQVERETAMRAFFRSTTEGRVHPEWVPIINELRALP